MAELLVAPDVVALLIAWLRDELPGVPDQVPVPVTRTVPDPRPPRFVNVRLLGGPGRDATAPLDTLSITVEAWAPTTAEAHDLAQNCRALVHAARGAALGGVQIYRVVDQGAPIDLPDPLSDQPRVTFGAELTVRIRRP